MRTMPIGTSSLTTTRLAYGCWRLAKSKSSTGEPSVAGHAGRRAVHTAYEGGYTLFDNADIYGGGECERIFGAVLKEVSGMRDRVIVATKGGIRPAGQPQADAPGRYDFSADYIISACE